MNKQFVAYAITNSVNGKRYVGITEGTPQKRWNSHVYYAKRKPNTPLARAINAYGRENFTIEVIASARDRSELQELEQILIKQENTLARDGQGYNATRGGDGGPDAAKGTKRSPEHIAAIKQAHTGKIVSEETRSKLRAALKGRKLPPEHVAAVRAAMAGKLRPYSAKVAANARANAERMRGKPLSDEHKAKLKAAWKTSPAHASHLRNLHAMRKIQSTFIPASGV